MGLSLTRRQFIAASSVAVGGALLGAAMPSDAASDGGHKRRYYVCLPKETIRDDPELLQAIRSAGVTDVLIPTFFYGYWATPVEQIKPLQKILRKAGLSDHFVNLALGHPGDALGATSGDYALSPPIHWKMGVRPDGGKFSGTSLHTPAVEENVDSLRKLAPLKPGLVFLDDDFRLAQSPGVIGGCYCDAHRDEFLTKGGYARSKWEELMGDVSDRRLSPILKAWCDYTCDQLTGMFRAQQIALGKIPLGIMVMYFGAEKAGIRLSDYRDVPFRVGELMFSDGDFGRLNRKTDELFSVLFHRRFVRPELAFSETTSYPTTALSPENLAAKLCISTIADVRNTTFMSGMIPYPKSHWSVLGPAMKKQAAIHEVVRGHVPRGPFKHFWGEHSRYVGDDVPFSLFLASGVPFEVCDRLPSDGWTFLSNADARGIAVRRPQSNGTVLCYSPGCGREIDGARQMEQSLSDLFALKHEILPKLGDVPYVVEDEPVVCAWYPTAKAALLWNLSEEKKTLTLSFAGRKHQASIDALDLHLLRL